MKLKIILSFLLGVAFTPLLVADEPTVNSAQPDQQQTVQNPSDPKQQPAEGEQVEPEDKKVEPKTVQEKIQAMREKMRKRVRELWQKIRRNMTPKVIAGTTAAGVASLATLLMVMKKNGYFVSYPSADKKFKKEVTSFKLESLRKANEPRPQKISPKVEAELKRQAALVSIGIDSAVNRLQSRFQSKTPVEPVGKNQEMPVYKPEEWDTREKSVEGGAVTEGTQGVSGAQDAPSSVNPPAESTASTAPKTPNPDFVKRMKRISDPRYMHKSEEEIKKMEEDEAQLEREHAEAARKAEEERQKYREKIEEAKRLGERLGKMPPLTKAGADFLRSKDLVLPTDNTKSREVRRKIEIFNPETGKKQEFNVYEEDESDEEGADVRAARMQEAKPTESEKLVVPSATIKRTFKAPQKPKNSDQQSEQPPAQPAN